MTNVRLVDWLGKEEIVMPAQINVGLLARQNQEIAIGAPAARFVIIFQLPQSQGARVLRMSVPMKVVDQRNVDSQRADGRNPGRYSVKAARVGQLLSKCRVEVSRHALV